MKQSDATRIARLHWRSSFARLTASGLLVSWKVDQNVHLGLNKAYPGYSYLCKVLRLLEPGLHPNVPKRRRSAFSAPTARVSNFENLFGWGNRTYFLILLSAFGKISRRTLAHGLSDCSPQIFRKNIAAFSDLGLIIETVRDAERLVQLNARSAVVAPLKSLLRAVTAADGDARRRIATAKKAPRALEKSPTSGVRLRWRQGVEGSDNPTGFLPRKNGAPLLFGSDARYRAFALLAKTEVMRMTKWTSIAKVRGHRTLVSLIDGGFVISFGTIREKYVALNPALPGQDELVRLLLRLQESYPAFDGALKVEKDVRSVPQSKAWTGDINKLCILPIRTKVLLTVAASRGIDQSSIARLFPEHDRWDLRQALHMFEAMKVFRRYSEGTAHMFTLNEHFVAYRELRDFLNAILRAYPAYRYRSSLGPEPIS
jgi:hypothetical protein